ncbi:DUF748 domain-containing protein [Agriterribacter humi]|uniref:DUF748 domain-containing protein n=1 Tax=Agriterribacter humi TaxID=1104781 RepID=UPI001264528A|nr:DUF748 domain-containing protein [Agriterribacter humi]
MKKTITRKRKIVYIVLGSLLIILTGLRIALPYILLNYVNKQLTMIDGYTGHVNDIDVALYRGAYTIKQIKLDKTGGKVPVPFFAADIIDLSVEWKALLKGRIVAEIEVERPTLNFVSGPSKATSQTDIDNDWTKVVDNLLPVKLNRFQVNNGKIHYRDFHSSPRVNIEAGEVHILAENLTNAGQIKNTLPSTVKASATVYNGTVNLDMKINPLTTIPTFDLNARLSPVKITAMNDFLQAYGNFDAETGTISMYCEAAAKDKKITGYVKPIIKDLKVANWKEDKKNLGIKVWESIVDAVGWVLTNKRKDQIATTAEFTGNIDTPDVNTWVIIGQLLRNAFIQALYPALENSINLHSVDKKEDKQTLLERIFEGGKAKKNSNKDKK